MNLFHLALCLLNDRSQKASKSVENNIRAIYTRKNKMHLT